MSDKHLSTQFDTELAGISTRVLEMGGLVEAQVAQAVYALAHFSSETAAQVLVHENRVNQMEVEIDRDLSSIIARTVERLVNTGVSSRLLTPVADLSYECSLATASLRKSLDAFARLDTEQAVEVIKEDNQIDQEFDGLIRKLITYMMEDPRTIGAAIDLVFVAKAIERVGDHAKNLAEQIIYIVKGTDVRHNPVESLETLAK
jgi:phosphate transport system protein